MPPRGSVNVDVVHQQHVAVALAKASCLDDDVAKAWTRGNVDLDLLDFLSSLFFEQVLVRIQARLALGLPRARRHANPVELSRERPLTLGFGLLLDLETLLLLLEPGRVVAFPRNAGSAVELENPASDVVEKVAIVCHRHDGAGVVLEKALEPGDRFRIEMVRRFVEEQQVRRLEQQPAERNPAPFAARQLGDVSVRRRQPQRIHREFQPRIEVPPVRRFDSVLDLALLLQDLVHLLGRQLLAELRIDLVVARQERLDLGDTFLDVTEHGLGRIESRFLRQEPDADAIGRPGLTNELLVFARHDPQECALPSAIEPEDANLRARKKGQPDVFQNDVVWRVNLPQAFHGVDELHIDC